MAVALRLGLKVCVPHSCHCGQDVDAWGLHAFVCKHARSRIQYIHQSATTAGAAAELTAARKVSKYDDIPVSFMFQPVALETLGPINESAIRFVENLGRRISAVSNEAREGVSLFQRLSVLMQRFNAIFVRDNFCTSDTSDLWSSQ